MYLYIIVSKTPTKMGKIIRAVTNYQYNHVSMILRKKKLKDSSDIKKMYSFARKYKDVPLAGGFVEESALRYKGSSIVIYEIKLTEEQFNDATELLNSFKMNRSKYLYDSFGALASILNKNISNKNSYTCIDFVSLFLSYIGYDNYSQISELVQDLSDNEIYSGEFVINSTTK